MKRAWLMVLLQAVATINLCAALFTDDPDAMGAALFFLLSAILTVLSDLHHEAVAVRHARDREWLTYQYDARFGGQR